MGLILYVISVILQCLFVPIGVIYGLIKSFYDTHLIDGLKNADHKFRKMAISTDVYGNVYGEELLNDVLLVPQTAVRFGDYGMTISQVLGYNLKGNTLTSKGQRLVKIVDFCFGKNHCIDSIKNPLHK